MKEKMKKICLECGKSFETFRPEAKYCCDRCRDRSYYKIRKARKPKTEKPKKICIGCGKLFTPTINAQKFCSKKCRDEQYNQSIRTIKKPIPIIPEKVFSYKDRQNRFNEMAAIQQKTGVSYGLQVALKPEQLKSLIEYYKIKYQVIK